MLIRWASQEERVAYGLEGEAYGPYDVVAAVDRMTGHCLGIAGFSRDRRCTEVLNVMAEQRRPLIEEKLRRVMDNQISRRGGSFHFRFPEYALQAQERFCPCCNAEPMPEGHVDVCELQHSWVIASPMAQGRLFGKCVVVAKSHSALFYDMAESETVGYIRDVKRVAKALHEVTEAVKVNYEIHGNSGPHLHCHLFPRYLDDDFPSAPIDYRIIEPSPYESEEEFSWFVDRMRKSLDLK